MVDTRSKGRIAKRALIVVAIVLAALACAGIWYVNDYYRADGVALAVMADEDGDADGVVVRELSDKAIAFVPDDPQEGLIFYPGAKVQPEAYAPLLDLCAKRGVLCVLVKPLFNLAIFDVDAAIGIEEAFPEVDEWMIGGHSMGGVAASEYMSRHESDFQGAVFLASYPSADLSDFDGAALSIAGTNDQVLNRESCREAVAKLPAASREVQLEGGNHANFGNYGDQDGDGVATLPREEQQTQTADAIASLL